MENKTTCVIIDDEPIAIRVIKSHLEKIEGFVLLGGFTDALAALKVLNHEQVDLLFLDIQMPGLNGISFLKSMQHPPAVIFTTAYRDYAADAFEVDAIDYLLKPVSFERFLKAINKFTEKVKQVSDDDGMTEPALKDFIILKSDKKNYKVLLDDIQYIESLDDYVKVHTIHKMLVCYQRLSALEIMLNSSRFVRIHRAFIINVKYVSMFTSHSVEINGKQIPIGRIYREQAKKSLT